MLHQVIHALPHAVSYVINNWQTIGAYTLAGTPIAVYVHRVEGTRGFKDLQKYGYILVGIISAAFILAQFAYSYMQGHGINPAILPKNFAYLTAIVLFLRKLAVSPLGQKISSLNVTNPLATYFQAVNVLKQQKAGISTTTNEVPAQPPAEFSL